MGFILVYFFGGVFTYGFLFGYFQRRWPIIAKSGRWTDFIFSFFMALFWPFSLPFMAILFWVWSKTDGCKFWYGLKF